MWLPSDSETAGEGIPQVDRTEKTQFNNQIRVMYGACCDAEKGPLWQYTGKQITAIGAILKQRHLKNFAPAETQRSRRCWVSKQILGKWYSKIIGFVWNIDATTKWILKLTRQIYKISTSDANSGGCIAFPVVYPILLILGEEIVVFTPPPPPPMDFFYSVWENAWDVLRGKVYWNTRIQAVCEPPAYHIDRFFIVWKPHYWTDLCSSICFLICRLPQMPSSAVSQPLTPLYLDVKISDITPLTEGYFSFQQTCNEWLLSFLNYCTCFLCQIKMS